MIVDETTYLAHYGVKGMRWGVRNDDEPSGNKKAKNKWSTKKKVAVGAAVVAGVLAVGGAWYIYNKTHHHGGFQSARVGDLVLDKYSDKGYTFKLGEKFQRISSAKTEDLVERGRTFVSFLSRDNRIYKEKLPGFIKQNIGNPGFKSEGLFVHTLKAKKNLNIASPRKAAELYSGMAKKLGRTARHEEFEGLVRRMVDAEDKDANAFIDILKEAGFNGVVDLNDLGWTKAPLIIFDPAETLDSKSRRLSMVERVINTMILPDNYITDKIDEFRYLRR